MLKQSVVPIRSYAIGNPFFHLEWNIIKEIGPSKFVKFDWQDPLNLDSLLNDEEKITRDSARQYCQSKLMPRVLEANRKEGLVFYFLKKLVV